MSLPLCASACSPTLVVLMGNKKRKYARFNKKICLKRYSVNKFCVR